MHLKRFSQLFDGLKSRFRLEKFFPCLPFIYRLPVCNLLNEINWIANMIFSFFSIKALNHFYRRKFDALQYFFLLSKNLNMNYNIFKLIKIK